MTIFRSEEQPMSDCPRCDAFETDAQMLREGQRALQRDLEAERKTATALRQDVTRLSRERDEWRAAAQRMVADRTYTEVEK